MFEFAAFFLSGSAADFLCRHGALGFTSGDEIQNGLQMEKACPFHLAGFADGHATEVFLARALVEFGAGKSRVEFHSLFGWADPNWLAVGLILE